MAREQLAAFLLQKVCISASQEEELNAAIPGWEQQVGRIVDETPSQQETPDSAQKLFDVTGSSSSDEEGDKDLSHKPVPVQWISPEPTPKSACPATTSQNSADPFDSDRSQSPKRRLSWGLPPQRDLSSPQREPDQAVADADDRQQSSGHKDADITTSTDAVEATAGDRKDSGDGRNEAAETLGQPSTLGGEEILAARQENQEEDEGNKLLERTTTAGNSLEGERSLGKEEARVNDERVEGTTSVHSLEPKENLVKSGFTTKRDSTAAEQISFPKFLRGQASACATEGREKQKRSVPPKAVQEKLNKIRRLGKETASAKQSQSQQMRSEGKTAHAPRTVMDVLTQLSGSAPEAVVSGADLLSAAVRVGITLPRFLFLPQFKKAPRKEEKYITFEGKAKERSGVKTCEQYFLDDHIETRDNASAQKFQLPPGEVNSTAVSVSKKWKKRENSNLL
ncbi:hypothetical protein R1sor_004652 [Riccia sorocarpa]|uniref:Uncharacterized protein n=1 Tax=Riccia sorocarpa TaxID=122646 RepID=A0ABD3HLK9_9MARC